MKYIYIKTLGCQMNEYDSYNIINILQKYFNINLTNNLKIANIIIINTCAVRNSIKYKIINLLKFIKKNKKKNSLICLSGCLAIQENTILIKKFKINIIFDINKIYKLPYMINYIYNKRKYINKIFTNNYKKYNNLINYGNNNTIITIIEGCNKYCSFCIVPNTKGFEKSRLYSNIILEIYISIINKSKELILLGQNINKYNNYKHKNLYFLIKYLKNIKNILQIKFISIQPIDLNKKFINIYTCNKQNKISNFLHLPLQSGSNKILKLMKRGYSIEYYNKITKYVQKINKNIFITTDIIIGFPQENLKEFKKTLFLLKKKKIKMSYNYIYSKRKNTLSFNVKYKKNIHINKKKINILNKISFIKSIEIKQKNIAKKFYSTSYNFYKILTIIKINNNCIIITDKNLKTYKKKKKYIHKKKF